MLTTITARISWTAMLPLALDLQCADEPSPATPPPIYQVETGGDHTCAVAEGGLRVRCWGQNDLGQLGQGTTEVFGDDETPSLGQDVTLSEFGVVVEVAAGAYHTCARSRSGAVRCWGYGDLLGVAAGENIGDDEKVPAEDVDFGWIDGDPQRPRAAIDLAVNFMRSCAVLDDNSVRCWGYNAHGELGLGFKSEPIGDDETIEDVPAVPVGASVRAIEAGGDHVCGLTITNNVRCWGQNSEGQLGYGHHDPIGDDDTPADAGDVELGGDVIVQVSLGGAHSCARTLQGAVRCWGLNVYGQLGYAHTANIGDDESPASAGYVKVDANRKVTDIAVGSVHTCAVLEDGAVKCWGYGEEGQLGHGDKKFIGDDETPASAPDVNVGGVVRRLTMGEHTCALLGTRKVRCWGINYDGQLGYGDTTVIGDDEVPASAGDVLVF